MKHAKETRYIFSGHPRSTKPSAFKTAAMFEDCVRYVLAQPLPIPIIDLDDYLTVMDSPNFDRSEIAIKSSVVGLPEIYTNQLIHRLFGAYIADESLLRDIRRENWVVP